MKINKKIAILFYTTLVALLIFPNDALCQTTIEDSTVPVEEGETYKWTCTYCHFSYSMIIGKGTYMNVTIDNIYQGSYMAIPNALIIDGTSGSWNKPGDYHYSEVAPSMVVYNYTLGYIYYYYNNIFMIPTPLNFTLVCEFLESEWGGTCNFTENTITHEEDPDEYTIYTYNSNGILTKSEYYEDDIKLFTFTLKTSSEQEISFGPHYILLSIVIVAVITLIIKKRNEIGC